MVSPPPWPIPAAENTPFPRIPGRANTNRQSSYIQSRLKPTCPAHLVAHLVLSVGSGRSMRYMYISVVAECDVAWLLSSISCICYHVSCHHVTTSPSQLTVFTARRTCCWPVSVCLSVCLSITLVYCIQTAKDIVKRPSQPDSSNILVSWGYPVLPNSKEKRLSAGVKYTGREKFALLDRNRSLSRKRYETRKAHSCYGTLIWSQGSAIDLCQFRWPWVTLKGGTRWVKFSGGSP